MIFSVTLIGIMGNALLSPAIPDVLAEFGEPDSSAGILVASMSIPGVFVAPVIGLLADRLGRRNVLVPCLVVRHRGSSRRPHRPSTPFSSRDS